MKNAGAGLAAFAVFTFVLGSWLLIRGRWGRRVGNVAHCRQCGYVLTGNTSGRCPECGLLLSENAIIYGERPRRPRSLWFGAALVLLASFIIFVLVARAHIDWYQFRPTSWVIADLDATNARKFGRAWNELKRRMTAHPLSAAKERALIDRALQEQQSPTGYYGPPEELVAFLGDRYSAHHLQPSQARRFEDNAMNMRLEVRSRVGPADRIAYRVTRIGRAPMAMGWWWENEAIENCSIDGSKVPCRDEFGGQYCYSSCTMGTLDSLPVGRHRIRFDIAVDLGAGPCPTAKPPVGLARRKFQLTADVTVLQTPPLITSVALPAAVVQRSLIPNGFQMLADGRLTGSIGYNHAPAPMACEVFAIANGIQYPLGSMHFSYLRGNGWLGIEHPYIQKDFHGPIDLILRSSRRVAIETTDMTSMWVGEITISNVPVAPCPATSQPSK